MSIASLLSRFAGQMLARVASRRSPVWALERDGRTLLLAGTMHLVRGVDLPLPRRYERAFASARCVAFETDLEAFGEPSFARSLSARLAYPQGDHLEHHLDGETLAALRGHLEDKGLDFDAMRGFRPSYVALSLGMAALRSQGFDTPLDLLFHRRARAQGKRLVALEAVDRQVETLLEMDRVAPDAVIRQAIEEDVQAAALASASVRAMRQGDLAALEAIERPLRDRYPLLHQALLVARNREWLPALEGLLEHPGPRLAMVGALHLVGPEGLLALLADRGFEVRPYRGAARDHR